jgi:hypothetical protein
VAGRGRFGADAVAGDAAEAAGAPAVAPPATAGAPHSGQKRNSAAIGCPLAHVRPTRVPHAWQNCAPGSSSV